MPLAKFLKKAKNISEPVLDGLPTNPHKLFDYLSTEVLAQYVDEQGLKFIRGAYEFAHKAHLGQKRKSGEHYIIHPVHVALTLAELRLDENTICAAILHDVVEDTHISEEKLIKHFGEDVATLVDGVSKIDKLDFYSKEQAEAENIRKMLLAMSKDIRVIIIKLADRLHNMRTLSSLRADKRRRISLQTLEIFAPIANRLGLYKWNTELQELCFKHIYPKRYKALVGAVKGRDGNRSAKVRKMRSDIQGAIDSASMYGKVAGRRKSVYSIYKKMVRKSLSFENLNDIYAFRILVDNVDDCYRALGVIHNHYKPIPGKFVDYIAIPKVNGYQSLHTVVFGPFGDNIEIQIRTEAMHQIAESGVAAHWIYKSGEENKAAESVDLSRQWLIDLLDPDRQSSNPAEFLEHLKTDLYADEVYVFTPKGGIKKMPRGATALDFAYAVHTGVGSKSSSAKINSKRALLSAVLSNGDHVEIITNDHSTPTLAQLNYTVTGRARSHIRSYLNTQSNDDARVIGKKLFKQALKVRSLRERFINDEKKQKLLTVLNIDTWDELLIEIGRGHRVASLVVRQIYGDSEVVSEYKKSGSLQIKGTEGLAVTYSRCCCPIPGDSIMGTVTVGSGLVIHTLDCPNLNSMQVQVDKTLPVEWSDSITNDFPVKIRVWVRNKRSIFAKVATIIAEHDCNILEVDVAESTEEFQPIDMMIEVVDRIHLARLIKQLRHHTDVQKLQRQKG